MKKVLLTTTAVVLTAGFASAGDSTMSGSMTLTYGSWGTGTNPGGTDAWTSEANLNVAAASSSGNITMSGTLELDESSWSGSDTGNSAGAVTIGIGDITLTYDANDIGALALENTATGDGEDDNYGDYSVSYNVGALSATYVGDAASDDSSIALSYTAGALTLGLTALDETEGYTGSAAGVEKTTMSAAYVTGAYTITVSADDQEEQDWDASVAMASGDTTVTVAADEEEVMSVAVAYAAGDMSASVGQEFNGGDSTTFGLGYTSGALAFTAAYDSGQGGGNNYGSEAELVVSATYTDGDVSVTGQANDQDEMEVAVSFSF